MDGLLHRLCFVDGEEARRRELYHPAPHFGATEELRHDRLHVRGRQRLMKAVFHQNGFAIRETPEHLFRLEGGPLLSRVPLMSRACTELQKGRRASLAGLAALTALQRRASRIKGASPNTERDACSWASWRRPVDQPSEQDTANCIAVSPEVILL